MARGSTGRGSGSGDASNKDTAKLDDGDDVRDEVDDVDELDGADSDADETETDAAEPAKSTASKSRSETRSRSRTKDAAKVSAAKSAVRQAAKASSKSSSRADRGKGGKSASGRPSGGRSGGRPPRGGKGVVANRRVPWVLILATIGVVIFAGVAIGYAVNEVNDAEAKEAAASASKDPTRIEGITDKGFPGGQHTTNDVSYGDTPPFGGAHDPEWADCSGTVYTQQIRSENAVHSLEHGAVWITYLPGLAQEEIDALADKVNGHDFTLMSPYPGQPTPISLQSWGFQLQVQSADDPRIDEFINATRLNPKYTPEYGASCANPTFKQTPRLPGQAPPAQSGPTDAPVSDSAGASDTASASEPAAADSNAAPQPTG